MERLSQNSLNNMQLKQHVATEKSNSVILAQKIAKEPQLDKIINSIQSAILLGKIKDEAEFIELFQDSNTAQQLIQRINSYTQSNKSLFLTNQTTFLKELKQEVDNIAHMPSRQITASQQTQISSLVKDKESHDSISKLFRESKIYPSPTLDKTKESLESKAKYNKIDVKEFIQEQKEQALELILTHQAIEGDRKSVV